MTSDQLPNDDAQAKYQEHFQRARKGVLKYLNDKGGKLSFADMHDYSLNKYLIQHQSFSRMMETFVDEGLVDFNAQTYEATITETGKNFIAG